MLTVDPGGRLRWEQAWPVLLRPTGSHQVHLVHGAGGPLGGDELALGVDVAAGRSLAVRSAAATVVQPGRAVGEAASWQLTAAVGAGGSFQWTPEPTVICDRAALTSVQCVDLAADARAVVREVVILGRHGQRGGRYSGTLTVRVDGMPLLAHTTVLDDSDAGLAGPGGTSGARAVGSLLLAGQGSQVLGERSGEESGLRWAWLALDGPGALLLAVGDAGPVIALLDRYHEDDAR